MEVANRGIYRAAKQRGKYPPLATDTEVNNSFGIQLFRERLSQKLCTRQSRKVIWDMINTPVLDTVAVEPTFVAFL